MNGYSLTISSKRFGWPSGPSAHLRENTLRPPTVKSMSVVRSFRSKRNVRSSTTTSRSTPASEARSPGAAYLPDIDSKLYFTSAAVTLSPLAKRAFGCSLKLIDDLSGATAMSSASSPYMVCNSSPDSTASDSNMKTLMPAGALPLVVNGLNLSKLERRSGLRRLMVPPRGASGLT